MHELSLVVAIVDKAREVLSAHGATRLVSVRVLLGVLSCARRESLDLCFPLVTRGTPLDGARLDIVDDPLVLDCRACGQRTERSEALLACALCGGVDVDVVGGRDVVISTMEVC